MHRAQWAVQLAQYTQAFRGDARFHHAAIFLLPFARDQAARFKAIEESRDIRIVGDHPAADFPARQAWRARTPQDAQDVELGIREIERLQYLFSIAYQCAIQAKQV